MTRRSMPSSFHANLFALVPARWHCQNIGVPAAVKPALGDVPFVPALGDTPCQGFGAKGTGCDSLADAAGFLEFSEPGGQKMPKMSTVAGVVSYRPYKIIDTTANMFINVGTQKPANGRFDQFEGK